MTPPDHDHDHDHDHEHDHDDEPEHEHGADCDHDHGPRLEPVRRATPKVGRNDPCPCGSGKKFKKCHAGQALG